MREVVEVMVRALVDHPEAVQVSETPERGNSIRVSVSVDPEDVGRVIGRGGKIAQAIRDVAAGAAHHHGLRSYVDFLT